MYWINLAQKVQVMKMIIENSRSQFALIEVPKIPWNISRSIPYIFLVLTYTAIFSIVNTKHDRSNRLIWKTNAYRSTLYILLYRNKKLLLWKITGIPTDRTCERFSHGTILISIRFLPVKAREKCVSSYKLASVGLAWSISCDLFITGQSSYATRFCVLNITLSSPTLSPSLPSTLPRPLPSFSILITCSQPALRALARRANERLEIIECRSLMRAINIRITFRIGIILLSRRPLMC